MKDKKRMWISPGKMKTSSLPETLTQEQTNKRKFPFYAY